MDRKTADELREDLEDFDIAMLVTKDGKFLRSRPMKPNINADGTIRFLTSKKTHKVDEVDSTPQANAVFSDDDGEYISVSGSIRLSDTQADIDELWSPAAAPWFENGKAEAIVLIMEPEIAEYWDTSDSKIKAGWEMVKGALGGSKPDLEEQHGKVVL